MANSPSQPYKRVMQALVERIDSGEFPVGTRLPSTSKLAAEYSVAAMTVRRALKELQEAGRVAPTHGVGWDVTEPSAEPTLDDRLATLESEVRELRERLEAAGL